MLHQCLRAPNTLFSIAFLLLPAIGLLSAPAAVPAPHAAPPAGDGASPVRHLVILTPDQSGAPERHAARILAERIGKRSAVDIKTGVINAPRSKQAIEQADLVFAIGMRRQLAPLPAKLAVRLPTLPNSSKVHPESFAVKSGRIAGKRYVIIVGALPRATIYGVGWVLRKMTFLADAVRVPRMDVRQKPAFQLRGGQPMGPGSRARRYGKLRPQTAAERQETMEDLMLLGTNIFEGAPATVHSYGMMTRFGRTLNQMPAGFPIAWAADGGRSRRYVCPSIPAARQALLESFDKMFRDAPDYDFFTTNSGDSGGCRCDKCMPWGGTYIRLLHEVADLLHKYHPHTKILATNQDLSNAGNQEIVDYLNAHDSSWLFALRYGPGADEMQTYIRGPVNPRWFEYEGFGPLGNYLKHLHHALPRTTNVALYTDITHWMQSQFGVPHPDVALAAVYNRRSWNARPRHFCKVAHEIFHYALGDMHYSEGMHDDFNKWVWYRLLWNPHLDAETLTKEYCRYWFGPAAQDAAAEAILLMETTLERPVLGNPGIARAVELLDVAGRQIPENLRRIDYRWRIISQKALMDRYIQLLLERGMQLKREAVPILERAAKSARPAGDLRRALAVLSRPLVTAEMKAIMQEAQTLGAQSNKIIGYRVPAMFIVDTLDLTEVGWWKKMLRAALDDGRPAKMNNAAKMLLHYDDPGEGGFYDNLGWPNDAKHLVRGEALWGFMPFPGPAKMSHYNLAYTIFEPEGVKLAYDGLDPNARYVVRISIGVHLDDEGEEADMLRTVKLKETVLADGHEIADAFVIPRGDITFQEFPLPAAATRDGKVEITLASGSKRLPITGAHEVWLMRRDKMPWTVKP